MNFKYLIFLCLMFIVSIGAVSAADDVNNTVDNTVDADTAINSVSVDSVIMDSPIYANNAKEYTITNDNYENYFDKTSLDTFDAWKTFLEKYVGYGKLGKKAVILDEYDREISLKEFLDMVDKKQSEPNIGNARLRDEYRFTGDIFY